MALVAGIDSSTQSCKVVIVDTVTGEIVRQGTAKHSSGTEIDPQIWWDALLDAIDKADGLQDVQALSIAGQQHGMVCLDDEGEVIRPAILWNDTRSASCAVDLINELGNGDEQSGQLLWAQAVGSVPVASITVTKVRWLADNEPDNLKRTKAICLPHDWLTWKLMGATDLSTLVTDRSDASGTGYVDCHSGQYRTDLFEMALNGVHPHPEQIILPRIAQPWECVGQTNIEQAQGIKLGPGCGDNAGAALGLNLDEEQANISIGTSGVVAAVSNHPICDPRGLVTGFMDATGRWLPLAATLNASRIIDAMKEILGVDYDEFDRLALQAQPGCEGMTLLPYFEGERTPNLPDATAELTGMTLANCRPENVARAAVEGLSDLLKGAMQALQEAGCPISRGKMLGGGAASKAVQEILPSIFGIDIDVPENKEYVALGAAYQAAKVLQSR